MNLRLVVKNTEVLDVSGPLEREILDIQFDSRKAGPDSLFVAVKGTQTDGHKFIEKAVEKGVKAIVCEILPEQIEPDVTYLRVSDSAAFLGEAASCFYGFPSNQLKLVGVTGTNGKTTCVTLLYELFTGLGFKCGLLSTIENKIGSEVIPSTHTTPDAVSINALLSEMVNAGCEYAFMEASSHAIDQKRIAGLDFAGCVFTNITHDHLDYHKTFQNYIEAKKALFDNMTKGSFALVNIDDKRGTVMVQNTAALVKTFALKRPADYKGKILENSLQGLHLQVNGIEVFTRLIGDFNAYNLLAVFGVASEFGFKEEEILTQLSKLHAAEGRFEYVIEPVTRKVGIVDYAHTPDALEKVLQTILQVKKPKNQVITVVGCGGDRDRAKRPIMAGVACSMSELVILTSDNPRSEDPETILDEMEAGVPDQNKDQVLRITSREQAIKTAVKLANENDIVLVAGKGHEKYQEIKGVKEPFDDLLILKNAFGLL
ncbi:MAG: UDP-N-acetylmuramoyl-L-alanyl-D-glutamate--2,6-diaminopimelate ligase [Saprospiraceae bacterium]|nr:UDP-N-acetylmuramoyl-L-alanyl-D-glutamate--2,6-diaminopimelate ligase [Saprospiraceae bacterium]